ncbi:MAG TPA: PQQ-binding-like beta-propeller repeat protein, partial [Myxococcaceae bacterium]|nr:PQQ-binding-like beta-propeller repeat protein [Myxococcaceae bacterium]
WIFETGGRFNASAAVSEGIAYVPGGDGTLYALRADSGELVWKYAAGDELMTTPTIASGKVLVATQGDALIAVDQKSGSQLWRYRRDSSSSFTVRGAAAAKVHQGVAYIGFSDGALVALRLDDGNVKWEKTLSTPAKQFTDVDTTPVFDQEGRLFAASYKDGIYALEPSSGAIQWHTTRPGITNLVLRGEVLFAGGDQQVGALFGDKGTALWSLDLAPRAALTPALARGLLIVPTTGPLVFVDPVTGHVRSFWNPGKGVSATPLWAHSRLYVLSNLGYLYSIRLHGRGG